MILKYNHQNRRNHFWCTRYCLWATSDLLCSIFIFYLNYHRRLIWMTDLSLRCIHIHKSVFVSTDLFILLLQTIRLVDFINRIVSGETLHTYCKWDLVMSRVKDLLTIRSIFRVYYWRSTESEYKNTRPNPYKNGGSPYVLLRLTVSGFGRLFLLQKQNSDKCNYYT